MPPAISDDEKSVGKRVESRRNKKLVDYQRLIFYDFEENYHNKEDNDVSIIISDIFDFHNGIKNNDKIAINVDYTQNVDKIVVSKP